MEFLLGISGLILKEIQDSQGDCRHKKIGAESGDPNLHPQPRLPGSVVGGWSMQYIRSTYKITAVTGHK